MFRSPLLCLLLVAALFPSALAGCAKGVSSEDPDPTGVDAGDVAIAPDAGLSPGDVADADAEADAGTDAAVDAAPEVDAADAAPDAEVVEDVVPDTDADADADAPPFPTVIVAVETRLSTPEVRAGDSVFVYCDALDPEGNRVALPDDVTPTYAAAPADSLEEGPEVGEFIGRRVGNATLACRLPTLGLVDATPEDLSIIPGVPHTVTTELDRVIITAGESITATCTAYDVYGNEVPDAELELLADPFGAGVNLFGFRAVIEPAGQYEMACWFEGAAELVTALLEVRPGLPATLTVAPSPDRVLFGIGEVVALRWTVLDRFGNRVSNAPIEFSSLPALPRFGQGRFRFDREGVFRLNATVGRPTESGEPLVAFVEVTVNDQGPQIVCDAPFDGEMVDIAPGERLVINGRVTDEAGVDRVLVNGEEAILYPGGTFETEVTTRYGVNFLQVEAFDAFGVGNGRVCAFLASDEWVEPGAFLDNDIDLRLAAAAFDDGNRGDGLDSITDLLAVVLNSPGVGNQIDAALRAADPLYPETCVVDAWLFCAVSFGVNYNSIRIDGPHDVSVSLVDGGLRTAVTLRNVELGLRIRGTFGTSGTIRVGSLALALTFDLRLDAGRPRITLRALDAVNVGSIDSNFSGITGFILDLIVDLFQGTIRNLVRDELSDFVSENFSQILDDLVANLDIDALGAEFDVPRLDGSGVARVGFGARFTEIDATRERARFALGSRFTGDVVRSDTLGAPLEERPTLDEGGLSRTVAANIDLGLLNQVLHALWQAGFFDVALGDAILGDDALDGVSVDVSAGLPIVVVGRDDGALGLHIGAWEVELAYPDLLAEPLRLRIGAEASARVSLRSDEEIDFEGLTLDAFYFDPIGVSLEPATREVLDGFFRRVFQRVLDSALEGALPALPVPAFELPASVAEFGLPAGAYLGLVDAVLEIQRRRFVLLGNFGTR